MCFLLFKSPERTTAKGFLQNTFLGHGRRATIVADPPDQADPRHGAWCTTPGTLAPEVRMAVVLNKLPQIIKLASGANTFTIHRFPNCPDGYAACALAAFAHNLSLRALGEGSGWDLRVCPSAPPPQLPPSPASGNIGTWKSGIPKHQNTEKSKNQNPFRPKYRQVLFW